jgi:succinoglycan biosynthesis protein ExoW
VLIPYYQKTPEVLRRALASIARQSVPPYRIVIVDDTSPLPAIEVMTEPVTDLGTSVEIHICSNRGPGGARNFGLDLLAADPLIEGFAFLDSDDVWEPSHLERASMALRQGDFYFSDYTWPSRSSTRFRQTGLIERLSNVRVDADLRRFDGDFCQEVLSTWPVHISAVAIRRDILGDIRFDGRLIYSSEDQHYFLQCAARTTRIYYDCRLGMRLDDGLNIYRRKKPGDVEFSRAKAGNAYFHRVVAKEMTFLTPGASAINRHFIARNIKDFIKSEIRGITAGRFLALKYWFLVFAPRISR